MPTQAPTPTILSLEGFYHITVDGIPQAGSNGTVADALHSAVARAYVLCDDDQHISIYPADSNRMANAVLVVTVRSAAGIPQHVIYINKGVSPQGVDGNTQFTRDGWHRIFHGRNDVLTISLVTGSAVSFHDKNTGKETFVG